MNGEKQHKERPEVYALRQDGGSWQISRRDFLKAAGIGAAAVGFGLNSRLLKPAFAEEGLEKLCKKAMAHEKKITGFYVSPDGKYLISVSDGSSYDDKIFKCWDFETGALVNTQRYTNIRVIRTAWIDGRPCLIVCSYRRISIRSLPDMDASDEISVSVNSEFEGNMFYSLSVDPDENLYVTLVSNKDIIKIERTDDDEKYGTQRVIYTDRWGAPLLPAAFDKNSLLVFGLTDFYFLDPESGSVRELDIPCQRNQSFSILPDGSRLVGPNRKEEGHDSSYGLYSLEDSSELWRKTIQGSDGGQADIQKITPVPDGTMALMLSEDTNAVLSLISLEDGSVINQVKAGSAETGSFPMAVSPDGTKAAVGVGRSIVFYSLPDLEVIGCPMDLTVMPDNSEAVEISGVDPVTGQTVTYTLPCGAAIPAGAVCVCNCVAGGVPSVKPTAVPTKAPCSCNSHNPCGCVGNVVTSHYWHPN